MLIKVCGMREADNIASLCKLNPDYLGFIFYEKSPRYAEGFLSPEVVASIPESISKTGVFVNANQQTILAAVNRYGLNVVQLHGNESPELCARMKEAGLEVLKAFHIDSAAKFVSSKGYEPICDFFLFDTPSTAYGGTGQKFNWDLLKQYSGNCPFFLSGGIGPGDELHIKEFSHPQFAGVDLNSRFESGPGMKNIEQLNLFFDNIRGETI